jgi:hypothetical protein
VAAVEEFGATRSSIRGRSGRRRHLTCKNSVELRGFELLTRITVRGRTKTEVKDKLRTRHTELAAGIRTPAIYTVEQCLNDCLETLNTQAESTLTGYRIMVRHLAGLVGNVKFAELKVRDVDFALGKLAKRLSTRGVRLARMIVIQSSATRW